MRASPTGLLALAVTALLAGCGGGERQDADAPTGTFAVDVTAASFPAEQSISSPAVLALEVANPGDEAVPDLAITVETRAPDGEAPAAFGQRGGVGLADAEQPVWVLDEGPMGGDSAYDNTWALGRLAPGQRKTVEWKLTPIRPGTYTVGYRLAPALVGSAGVEGEDTAGEFEVTISDEPVPARVNGKGEVVRGDGAGR
jgi:hypothetical protein